MLAHVTLTHLDRSGTIKYAVVKCDADARKLPDDVRESLKRPGFMDMFFYEKIARVVRGKNFLRISRSIY